jgi:hypothetical protein
VEAAPAGRKKIGASPGFGNWRQQTVGWNRGMPARRRPGGEDEFSLGRTFHCRILRFGPWPVACSPTVWILRRHALSADQGMASTSSRDAKVSGMVRLLQRNPEWPHAVIATHDTSP